MIEPDLAELVDDHDRAGERCILQQAVEQCSLAGTQEAGEHGEGDRLGGLSQVVARAHFFWVSVLGAGFAVAGRGAACAAVCAVVADAAVGGAAVVRTTLGRGRGNGTEEPSSGREASSGP